jgi:uncharacterized protein (TIGR02246 family)
VKADGDVEAGVRAVLDALSEAYGRKDVEAIAGLFADDPDASVIGTGVDEKRFGRAGLREQLERDFAEAESLGVSVEDVRISGAGPVAWAVADAVVRATVEGESLDFPLRMSAVLEARAGSWLIQHAHFSAPMAGQEGGESFPSG